MVDLFPAGTPSYTIKFVKSNQEDAPDFTAAVSATNLWTYCDVIDLADQSSIDGATGVTISGAGSKSYEYNINGALWFGIVCTAYTSGTISGNSLLTNNV
tara:strand:+ start:3601 stop:3900 length:300 start_codon:yes stop_codon:yes gene_type:complete